MTNMTEDSEKPLSTNGARLHVVRPAAATPAREMHPLPQVDKPQRIGFLKALLGRKPETTLHEALKEFVAESPGKSETRDDERALISNILSLRDMRAVDVMIPRADIIAIDIATSPNELLALLSEKQYSRFPIYRESLDDIVGTIHIKDILATLARKMPLEIENLVRDVPIVSPSMHVLDLMLEMKETRRHMALVIDEFGGIDGLVTVGDIIEAIIGEIEDEHEVDDQPQLMQTPDGLILADGRVSIQDFENHFGQVLSESERQDIDTLGGLVFAIAGRVPARGEVVSHDSGLVFEVLDADPRRVQRLRIKNTPKEESGEQ